MVTSKVPWGLLYSWWMGKKMKDHSWDFYGISLEETHTIFAHILLSRF